jgi:hypothetical protein
MPILIAALPYLLPTAVSAVGAVFSFLAHKHAKKAVQMIQGQVQSQQINQGLANAQTKPQGQ